ncbi:MAG: aldo/keto reductase [Anaerolineales bacterium]|nr:aldo/keto reductase [Anaerolineales bacterium]
MRYNVLGNSGLLVSEVCMGAMTFGRETSRADSLKMLDRYKDTGGNFIDTANVYSHGLSEEILGEWLGKQKRDEWVIATKVRFSMGDKPNQSGLGRKHMLESVEASLKRMETDYADILYAHAWDYRAPLEETLETFSDLVRQGKICYAAVSNYGARHIQRAADLSHFRGYTPYIALQAKYNLMVRSAEWELLPACEENGLGFVVWGPLFGGWLSGRYHRGMSEPPDGRIKDAEKHDWFEKWSRYNTGTTWAIIDRVIETARRLGKSPAQVSLNWLLNKSHVTSVILGASKISHLEDNLGCLGWSLDEEDMAALDSASNTDKPYPYDFLEMAKNA